MPRLQSRGHIVFQSVRPFVHLHVSVTLQVKFWNFNIFIITRLKMMKFGQNDVNATNITSITEELEKKFNFFRILPSNWTLFFEPD